MPSILTSTVQYRFFSSKQVHSSKQTGHIDDAGVFSSSQPLPRPWNWWVPISQTVASEAWDLYRWPGMPGHGLSMSFVPWAIVCHRPTHHTAHLWLKVMFHERLQQSELRLREDEMHPAQPQWDDKWHPTCYDHNSDSEPGSIICKVIVSANIHQASSDVMSTRNSTCC